MLPRLFGALIFGALGFFAIRSAFRLMDSAGGSAAGLMAIAFLGAIFIIAIVGILSSGKEQKTNIQTMARRPRK